MTPGSESVSKVQPVAFIALALAAAWSISIGFGGERYASPLWLIAPVLYVAVHHRPAVALIVALIAGVLAGPLTPADVALGTPQPVGVWFVRILFFVATAMVISREVRRVRVMGQRDPLTALLNRAALGSSLNSALARARRRREAVGLVYIDLDGFKLVNDRHGHSCGDELLRQVAQRLEACKRSGDVLARHGGDEFVVLLDGLGADHDAAAAEVAAAAAVERMVGALEEPFEIAGTEVELGCSAGLSLFPADAHDADDLHRHADAAMYRAKSSGARWQRHMPSRPESEAPLSRSERLRAAIDAGGLELHYQPIFAVGGDIVGVEALVRWRDGDAGLVPPSEFIPLAESSGSIDAIGDWVLNELCRQALAWREEGLEPHLGLNVAPRQLRRPDFAEAFSAVVSSHGLPPSAFVIELTESAWSLEESTGTRTLCDLRAAGFSLAMDDFGAGHSSLSRLHALPVDVIKIDRSLLQDVPGNSQAVAVMKAVFQLAAACGSEVVAEGVETDAQYAFLAEQGCELAQGYALGRPTPAGEIGVLLHERLTAGRRRMAGAEGVIVTA